MSGIRPLREDDIPRVAELHRRVFRVWPHGSPELHAAYRRWLLDVFLRPPWREEGIDSLVHEGGAGNITGFIGVVPRRMTMNGRSYLGAVSSQFVVDERSRSQLDGVKLLKAFFAGPQDLSLADEAGNGARKLWEALGGRTAPLHSLGWIRPVRPCSLAASYLRRRRATRALARVGGPIARAADALAMRLPFRPLRQDKPSLREEVMSPAALGEHLAAILGRGTLRPDYGPRTLSWALGRVDAIGRAVPPADIEAARTGASGAEHGATLDAFLLRDGRGAPVGSVVYSSYPRGIDQVLHFAASPAAADAAVQHLLQRAVARGALALEGRLDLRLLPALSDRHALFHRRHPWVLVASRHADLVSAFERGDAFFSRLDGELCLRFPEGSP